MHTFKQGVSWNLIARKHSVPCLYFKKLHVDKNVKDMSRNDTRPFPVLIEMPPSVISFDQANIGRRWIHMSVCFRLFSHHSPLTGSWHIPISDNWQYESTQFFKHWWNQIASRFQNSKSWEKKSKQSDPFLNCHIGTDLVNACISLKQQLIYYLNL